MSRKSSRKKHKHVIIKNEKTSNNNVSNNDIPDVSNFETNYYDRYGVQNVDMKQYGHTGINLYGGNIDWEYQLNLLTLSERMDTWKQMRSSDGAVDVSLRSLEEPLKSKSSQIVPFDDSPESLLHAAFVHDQLIGQSNISYNFNLNQHAVEESRYLQYGFMPFEMIWVKDDWFAGNGKTYKNMVVLKKLDVRLPCSIDSWWVDNGKVVGLIQQQSSGDICPGVKTQPHIPFDKLLLYVNNKLGDNYEGTSILRSVYKHWKYKECLYKIEIMGLQKVAFGTPVISVPPNAAKIEQAKNYLRSMNVNEEIGVVLVKGQEEFQYHNGGIESVAIQRAIQHHDTKIHNNTFSGFLLLGQENRGGARALGASLIEFFALITDSLAKYSDEVKNLQLIPRMISYNFSNFKGFPQIKSYYTRIQDKQVMAEIISKMVGNGVLNPADMSLKDFVHTFFGVPESKHVKDYLSVVEEDNEEGKDTSLLEKSVNETVDIKKKPSDKSRTKINTLANNILDRQEKELSERVTNLMKSGIVPNINYFDICYEDEIMSLINLYLEECECECDSSYDVVKSVFNRYNFILKRRVIDSVINMR